MTISGRTWDYIHAKELEFKEIREGRATYYIADFEFIDREWRFFDFSLNRQVVTKPTNMTSRFNFGIKIASNIGKAFHHTQG